MPDHPAATLNIEALSPAEVAPFGNMLGKPYPSLGNPAAFSNAATDFWQEHLFDVGQGGEVEILWVNYRNDDPSVTVFEKHVLTEQAVVPLLGSIIQIVALSGQEGWPDLSTARAFHIEPG